MLWYALWGEKYRAGSPVLATARSTSMHWSGFLLPAVGPQGSPAGLKAQGSGTDHGPHTMSNCEPLVTAPAVPTLSVQIGCQAGDAPIDEPQLARRKVA